MSNKPETDLSRAIQHALRHLGALVVRVQSGVLRGRAGSYVHLAQAGTPDLWVAYRGGSGWLEVKRDGKRASERGQRTLEQIAWAVAAEDHGVHVAEVRSVEQALRVVRGWAKEAA